MKKLFASIAIAVAFAASAAAEENIVNIYNWSDYIADDTVAKFEADSGIKVRYDVFDSNEMLEAKLLTGSSGYDVVVPSIEFMARQSKAGVFQKIDKKALTNYGNLDKGILDLVAVNDPDNTYGVPYMMFTVGLGYNVDKIAKRIPADKIGSWDMFFNKDTVAKLADCGVAVLNSPSEVMAAALHYLKLKPNSEDSGDLAKAHRAAEVDSSSIRYFNSSQYINDLANGDICLVLGYSGDVLQAKKRAAEAGQGVKIAYAIPREGAEVGFDMLAIPADAPNPKAALKFIDFILRPETAAAITNHVFYNNPNKAATELVDEKVRNDPGIYPPDEVRAKLYPVTATLPAVRPKPDPRLDQNQDGSITAMKKSRGVPICVRRTLILEEDT